MVFLTPQWTCFRTKLMVNKVANAISVNNGYDKPRANVNTDSVTDNIQISF